MKYSKQHPNTTGSLAFNGQDNADRVGGYNSKYQHKAAGIPSAKENYGRGPTVGNKDNTTITGRRAPATAGNPSMKQVRGSGTTAVPACSYDINVGRGPTKGNQQ